MIRGNVPGYYYDEEKKKYFKIQANHLVPQGAKYTKENVKREKRATKKQKLEEEKKARRERNTIKRAPVLKSATFGGIGLEREHGVHLNASRRLVQYEHATVSEWVPQRTEVRLPKSSNSDTLLQHAHYIPQHEQMVFAFAHRSNGASVIQASPWEWQTLSEKVLVDTPAAFPGVAAFNNGVSAISTVVCGHSSQVLVCAQHYQVGNIYIGSLPSQFSEADEMCPPGTYLTYGPQGSSIGDAAFHPTTENAAIIGSCGIFIIDWQAAVADLRTKPSGRMDWPHCEPCIHWLNHNTVVYGEKAQQGYSVMLWDVRTQDGRQPRFHVRDRLTGVFNPTKYGTHGLGDEHQIYASTNHHIDLFDTRMPKTKLRMHMQTPPVLSFPHIHGGPRLQRATHGNLVAAVDADNVVQVYSIQTGAKVRSLPAPPWKPRILESPILRQLMWYDDIRSGSTLQAVRGNGVVRWVWGGGNDDEE